MMPRKTGGRLVCDPFTDVPLYGLKVRERPAPVIRFPKLAGRYAKTESCFSELPESGHRFVERQG